MTDLCSDLVAGAAIAMTRVLQCPFDGGEDGPLAMRASSQPTALCPFEASQPPPLCVASCEDAALARTASKVREDSARPVAAVGQEGRRAGALVRRRAAQKVAGPPKTGQSGCHGSERTAAWDRLDARPEKGL